MKYRAILFDVYGTLLDVGPPPKTAADDWTGLYLETFHRDAPFDLSGFAKACAERIERQHQRARALGIANPEVVWPSIVGEVLPAFAALRPAAQDEFILRQIRLSHTVSLHRDAALLLPRLRATGHLLGIASNAQAYTVRELRATLISAGLDWDELFEPDLCFWSYLHGFSKPDPYVFQILGSRLDAHGVQGTHTLMVGDRLDNDIEPSLRHGWKAWWLTDTPGGVAGGAWPALCRELSGTDL